MRRTQRTQRCAKRIALASPADIDTEPQVPVIWQANQPAGFVWRALGAEQFLFNPLSAQTHILNTLGATVLQLVIERPRDTEELLTALIELEPQSSLAILRQHLQQLDQLGLIERQR